MKTARFLVALAMTVACSTASPTSTTVKSPSPTSTATKSPPARGYHFMAGLGTNPGILLFSGETAPPRYGGYNLGDMWLWRAGKGWTQKSGLGHKYGFACYDPKAGRMVVLITESGKQTVVSVGFDPLAENWTYDPQQDSWQQRALDQRPEFLNGTAAALDSESDRLIAFDGDTWAYDPAANSWRQMHPKNSPQFGSWSAFVYDEKRDRLILLGGEERGPLSDVWTYDFNHDAWTEADAGSGPSGRLYAAAAYDARSGRLILFGGMEGVSITSSGHPVNDTWSYDLLANKWTELKPKTSPPARGRHAMAFDSESGKIVMFGGGPDPRHFQNDTWTFDPLTSNWSKE